MARQNINIGTTPDDGTGDTLRDGGDIINDNFIELYSTLGWGNYSDAVTTPASQTFNTTPSKLQIDGGGSTSESGYLPREIRGSAELWDVVNDKLTPISVGDAYDVRVSLGITGKTGSPTVLTAQMDIGGTGTPTIVVASIDVAAGKTAPFTTTFSFPIFTLATFLSNGGEIFISSDSGTITVGSRSIFIKRDFNGST